MKNMNIASPLFYLIFLIPILIVACNEFNEPTSIYQSDKSFPTNPSITSISPIDHILYAGITGREIVVTGNNFSTVDSTYVYFSGKKGLVKSITPTAMVIYRPMVYGDSVPIAIEVPSALGPAHLDVKYKIERPIYPYLSAEVRLDPHTSVFKFYCMLVGSSAGANEVLYVAENKRIYRISQVTTNEKQVETVYRYKTEPAFNTQELTNISCMKFGPDDSLYFATESGNSVRIFRTVGEPMGTPESAVETFVTFATSGGYVRKLDFYNNTIFCGYSKGIYLVNKLNRKFKSSGRYVSPVRYIYDLHIYNGYVYVAIAAAPSATLQNAAIYRLRILQFPPDANGITDSLDTPELVLDVAQTSPGIPNTQCRSFALDSYGTLYLCLYNPAPASPLPYSLYVYENNSLVPFYHDNIIPPYVDQIVWGQNQDAYLNRSTIFGISSSMSAKDSVRICRMGMGVREATK